MPRHPRVPNLTYAFGPGPITPAVKYLLWANIGMFLATSLFSPLREWLGLVPEYVIQRHYLWQPATYLFVHGSIVHILFNMLALWMFGVELERMWGTRFFLKFYFVAGVGAALTTTILSLLPVSFLSAMYTSVTIGASGAIYGVLLAYAMYYPNRP